MLIFKISSGVIVPCIYLASFEMQQWQGFAILNSLTLTLVVLYCKHNANETNMLIVERQMDIIK